MEEVVQKTLEELMKNKLIPENERDNEKITEELKEAAQKEEKLTAEMEPMIGNKNMREVEQAMSAIIGRECVRLIKNSFAIETYRMKVVEKPDGQSAVQVHRKGVEFQPEIMLMTINDIEAATWLQLASLLIELLLFLLSCVGIGVDLSEVEMKTVVDNVKYLVRESAFQRALKFVDAWNEAGGNVWGKAKAIFYFLKDIYSLGIFWKIIRLIFKLISYNKLPWEMRKAKIEVVSMIVAAFNIERLRLGLVARIALAVDSDVYLAEKIANLVTFSDKKPPPPPGGMAADNMYLMLKKCLQNMIYFTNKEIFSGNDPLNFIEKKGCYDFF